MALGSLLDAGADPDEVRGLLGRLPIGSWSISIEPVLRAGVAATRVVVDTVEDGVVRTHAHIAGLIEEARLPERVRDRSLATFSALATVEGRLHRRPPSQVHFHEIGGVDAIVDIVGTCAALEVLGVDEVHSSPIATGMGMVRTSHGLLPNPSPAAVALLEGIPTYGREVPVELTTPTGAALVSTLASGHGALPEMSIETVGYGAGTRELDDLPNCTQVVIGVGDAGQVRLDGEPVVLLETNLDDATGEMLAHAVSVLLDAGAHDAWITPVVMKKGRPAHVLSALADVALTGQVVEVMRAETGTLGVRGQLMQRWPMPRVLEQVDVDGLPVRVKVSPGRVKAEHDDAVRVASLRHLPLREVTRRAEEAWRTRQSGPGPVPGPGSDGPEAS